MIDQDARLMAEQFVIGMFGTLASTARCPTRKFIEPQIILREHSSHLSGNLQ
ncbi:hypothetical protein [Rhizobium gallicum]|uniref:hypothetical protein n=1 Tax=Rhizobium gallicum TaxID=56730 RepID=UPI000B04A884|nr:hypothetical protein [Rhizobium gallicum]